MTPELSLANREALPDALHVLLREYPRESWQSDPGFNNLIAFWLDRHLMFRRLMAEMRKGTEALLDAKMQANHFGGMVSRYGGMFVQQLHGHHTIEDQHYFPLLVTKDARIEKGFAILDKDHHDLDEYLSDFVTRANEVIGVTGDRTKLQNAAGGFQEELVRLERLLDRHLIDEEDLIVPVILRYGAEGLG
jgi:iron-sulfur cluster repair protein YtfE (RIC family)